MPASDPARPVAAHVLTLVGAGPGSLPATAVSAVARALGVPVGTVDWLAPGQACDLACDPALGGARPDEAAAAARTVLGTAPVDLVVQSTSGRRKRLLLADMDSTMVTGETLDEMADFAGLKAPVAAITARAMNGEIDFAGALRERVALLRGLPEAVLAETWARIALTPGARELVRTMAASGARTVLISGGFRYFTGRVRALCGFDEDLANDLEIAGGRLTGRVQEPILDKTAKLAALHAQAAALGVAPAAAVSVGDGANDLPMLLAAGLGVAFRAKPSVAAAAPVRVEHGDLTALLYFQGYRRDDFVTG